MNLKAELKSFSAKPLLHIVLQIKGCQIISSFKKIKYIIFLYFANKRWSKKVFQISLNSNLGMTQKKVIKLYTTKSKIKFEKPKK